MRNALRDPQIKPDAKNQLLRNMSQHTFYGNNTGPPEHEKYFIDVLLSGRSGMHFVTYRSHQMQKHKFSVFCPGWLFMETAQGPPKHEK
jgi:hypothetical protein